MMKNKTTLTFGERTFELTFYAEHTITLHERSLCAATRAMYLSHSAGRGDVSTGRFISWSLLYKAWMAGVYTPETPEFAKQLQNHKDLSFRIENIKEIKLYADAAVSVGTVPPYELVEITFAFDWTQSAASQHHTRVSVMPFIVVSPAHFAA